MSVEPLIVGSARRHKIADEDMRHAYRNTIWMWERDDGVVMHTGPARNADLLEIGVVTSTEGIVAIIHAMRARSKYLR